MSYLYQKVDSLTLKKPLTILLITTSCLKGVTWQTLLVTMVLFAITAAVCSSWIYHDCKNNMEHDFWNLNIRNRHYLLPMHRTCCNKRNFSNLPTKNLQKSCWYHLPTVHNKQTTEHTLQVSNNPHIKHIKQLEISLSQKTKNFSLCTKETPLTSMNGKSSQ